MGNNKLGRGLGSLLPENFSVDTNQEMVLNININDLIPNPDQPRKTFEQISIDGLANSIKEQGLLVPIIVTKHQGKYMIIAGERRYRAAMQAGLITIPAIVRSIDELRRLEFGLLENVQREDLSPLEQAESIKILNEQFSQSYDEIANKLGKALPTISNLIRLLKLPDNAKQALINKEISEGHARALLALEAKPEFLNLMLGRIINEHLSVRQAEALARTLKQQDSPRVKVVTKQETDENRIQHYTTLAEKFISKIGVKTVITPRRNGGVINIHFTDQSELDDIAGKLSI